MKGSKKVSTEGKEREIYIYMYMYIRKEVNGTLGMFIYQVVNGRVMVGTAE